MKTKFVTAALGAVLLTGYLGGAIATHLRVGSPVFSHTLFGIYMGAILWGGLILRHPRIGALLGIGGSPQHQVRNRRNIR